MTLGNDYERMGRVAVAAPNRLQPIFAFNTWREFADGDLVGNCPF